MAITRVEQIAGYDGFKNEDVVNTENPFAVQVHFKVISEEMPAKTRDMGKIVRENFVWIFKEWDLGNSVVSRRIRDKVHFDEATGKWKVDWLAPNSDIEKYTQQWNAFVAGNTDNLVGTALILMFKNDPSKVENYARWNIKYVEQVAALTDDAAQSFGMGGMDDKKKAIAFLSRIDQMAPSAKTEALLADKEEKIASLQKQLSELSSKVSAITADSGDKDQTSPRRGRPPRKLEDSSQITA